MCVAFAQEHSRFVRQSRLGCQGILEEMYHQRGEALYVQVNSLEFSPRDPVNEGMCFESNAFNLFRITGQEGRAYASKGIENTKRALEIFLLTHEIPYPVSRESCRVSKPAMDRKAHVVDKSPGPGVILGMAHCGRQVRQVEQAVLV